MRSQPRRQTANYHSAMPGAAILDARCMPSRGPFEFNLFFSSFFLFLSIFYSPFSVVVGQDASLLNLCHVLTVHHLVAWVLGSLSASFAWCMSGHTSRTRPLPRLCPMPQVPPIPAAQHLRCVGIMNDPCIDIIVQDGPHRAQRAVVDPALRPRASKARLHQRHAASQQEGGEKKRADHDAVLFLLR